VSLHLLAARSKHGAKGIVEEGRADGQEDWQAAVPEVACSSFPFACCRLFPSFPPIPARRPEWRGSRSSICPPFIVPADRLGSYEDQRIPPLRLSFAELQDKVPAGKAQRKHQLLAR
jgi:hypothetical protein